MPRHPIRSFLVLAGAVTLLLTAGLLWISPEVAQALPPCGEPYGCDCGAQRQTAMVWGMGADCATAFQDAVNHGRALFTCESAGTCEETFVITTGCWFNGTQQQVDGYMIYRCLEGCSINPCEPWDPESPKIEV